MSSNIASLILGRMQSEGFPGKNLHLVLGRPLAYYPIRVAIDSVGPIHTYLSTDDPRLKRLATNMMINVIDRPAELCTKEALGEDAFVHGYNYISKRTGIEFLVLMFCNAPTVTVGIIEEGIRILRDNPNYDSAVTVSRYNMWSPGRARLIGEDGLLYPFVPFESFGDPAALNCDRDSQGDVWFADMGASIVRPRCIENIKDGLLPQRWMGRNIFPLKQEGGLDVDYEWQIPMAEHWLREHGHAEAAYRPANSR